jgi:hypothetical protein
MKSSFPLLDYQGYPCAGIPRRTRPRAQDFRSGRWPRRSIRKLVESAPAWSGRALPIVRGNRGHGTRGTHPTMLVVPRLCANCDFRAPQLRGRCSPSPMKTGVAPTAAERSRRLGRLLSPGPDERSRYRDLRYFRRFPAPDFFVVREMIAR